MQKIDYSLEIRFLDFSDCIV